eukprot:GHVL01022395.1.p2 GENE.GHVL01022395.1~~GHVL01022395.1.p2  ORF type:complete len:335 (+),score=81.22 GHVL01022395.1:163-1167(+)
MALKFLDNEGLGVLSDAMLALDWAVSHGARITCNSWGSFRYSETFLEELNEANRRGVLFVASAGNQGSDLSKENFYPPSYASEVANVMSVGAVNYYGTLQSFSNRGKNTIQIAAPGWKILSSIPTTMAYSEGDTLEPGLEVGLKTGTSMACPHVIGVAAIIWLVYPSLTPNEIIQSIVQSAAQSDTLQDTILSGGILDGWEALKRAKQINDEKTNQFQGLRPGGMQGMRPPPSLPTTSVSFSKYENNNFWEGMDEITENSYGYPQRLDIENYKKEEQEQEIEKDSRRQRGGGSGSLGGGKGKSSASSNETSSGGLGGGNRKAIIGSDGGFKLKN